MSDLYVDQDGDLVIVTLLPKNEYRDHDLWLHESSKYYIGPWIHTSPPENYDMELLENDFDRKQTLTWLMKQKIALLFIK